MGVGTGRLDTVRAVLSKVFSGHFYSLSWGGAGIYQNIRRTHFQMNGYNRMPKFQVIFSHFEFHIHLCVNPRNMSFAVLPEVIPQFYHRLGVGT